MEILGKLFNSPARVKIMRLFLLNGQTPFENKDITKRSRVTPPLVRREVSLLSSIDFITKTKKGWVFNADFQYAAQLERLLVGSDHLDKDGLSVMFKKAGKVKLLLVAGSFIKDTESRVDMLIVGDKIKKKVIEDAMAKLEAEMGKELSYALFETAEFIYRHNMYDKLIHDILDFPYEAIVETKELSTQTLKKA